jgi:hypothetical protein
LVVEKHSRKRMERREWRGENGEERLEDKQEERTKAKPQSVRRKLETKEWSLFDIKIGCR